MKICVEPQKQMPVYAITGKFVLKQAKQAHFQILLMYIQISSRKEASKLKI